ncbi:MAG TPA: ScyD/ScyE family protein [Terriglobales bacterium]|nr:ScyD/ScyE family protein [Terriglobales bacterium]
MNRIFSRATVCCALWFMLFASFGWSQSNVSVFATGLNNPRGLKFGPDGNLYVAEGGAGGSISSAGLCDQVIPPIGPYTGGFTARISKISPDGTRTTVVDELPSDQTSAGSGGLVSGVADVAFLNGKLYAILAGAGCSHGLAGTNNGVIRVDSAGSWTMVANLSAYQKSHPVANPEPDDFEPDGTWYSMIANDGLLFAVEPNHGELVSITPSGSIHRVADISRVEGHIVPTAMVSDGEGFLVGNLDTFPIKDSSKIMRITRSGQITTIAIDFETILGLALDGKGRLYVLENTTGNPFPTPGTGKIVRIDGKHQYTDIATGLVLPTAMTFGPDGNLYVSNVGFGPPLVGLGQVLKITVP